MHIPILAPRLAALAGLFAMNDFSNDAPSYATDHASAGPLDTISCRLALDGVAAYTVPSQLAMQQFVAANAALPAGDGVGHGSCRCGRHVSAGPLVAMRTASKAARCFGLNAAAAYMHPSQLPMHDLASLNDNNFLGDSVGGVLNGGSHGREHDHYLLSKKASIPAWSADTSAGPFHYLTFGRHCALYMNLNVAFLGLVVHKLPDALVLLGVNEPSAAALNVLHARLHVFALVHVHGVQHQQKNNTPSSPFFCTPRGPDVGCRHGRIQANESTSGVPLLAVS